MSNLEFFNRYKTNIFGLTGTMGTQADIKFIKETYNCDV